MVGRTRVDITGPCRHLPQWKRVPLYYAVGSHGPRVPCGWAWTTPWFTAWRYRCYPCDVYTRPTLE